METQAPQTFEDIKARLDEIVEAVSDEELPLDQVLGLYEEAVGIGLAASRIMEEGIAANTAEAVDQAQQPQVQVESAVSEQQNEANGE